MATADTINRSAPRFEDRLTIDLATAPLLHTPLSALTDRIRSELTEVRDRLLDAFPSSAIVLTGSFFAGTGQAEMASGVPVIHSDYDVFVVSPGLLGSWPAFVRRRLDPAFGALTLSTRLDISLVWEPLLRRRHTTIGGAVIGGQRDLAALLPSLPAPSAHSALLQAYRFLSAAPMHPEWYASLCARGLMRGAHALLLSRVQGRPRKDWIDLFSMVCVRNAIERHGDLLGGDVVADVQRACGSLLGERGEPFRVERHQHHAHQLGRMADAIEPSRTPLYAAKHGLWLLSERRLGLPRGDAGKLALRGLRTLAESWRAGGSDADGVRDAARAARALCFTGRGDPGADPINAYAGIRSVLSSFAGFNPHRISYGPQGVPI